MAATKAAQYLSERQRLVDANDPEIDMKLSIIRCNMLTDMMRGQRPAIAQFNYQMKSNGYQ